MGLALEQANTALINNEVPIGAVIVKENTLVSSAYNQTLQKNNACAHAEILCIQKACQKLGNHRLTDTQIYITLEPCLMCYGAIIQSRIPYVYFGAFDQRTGTLSQQQFSKSLNLNHHPVSHGGILQTDCQHILTSFFKQKRST